MDYGLNNKEYQKVLADSSSNFHCILCKKKTVPASSSSSSFSEDLADIKISLKKLFTQHAELFKNIDNIKSDVKSLKTENLELKKSINQQNIRLKALENVRLKSQCFFKVNNENVDKNKPKSFLMEVVKSIGVDLIESDVKSVVIQPKLSVKGMSVMKIEFKDSDKKFEIMKNKSKCKNIKKYEKVSFFDVLSRDAAELYKSAKSLKAKGYKFVYSRNGKVFVKSKEDSQPILVTSKKMILELPFLGASDDFQSPDLPTESTNRRRTLAKIFEIEDEDEIQA